MAVVLVTGSAIAVAKPLQSDHESRQYFGDGNDYNDSLETSSDDDDNSSTSVYDSNEQNYSSADYDGGDLLRRLVKRSDNSADHQPETATATSKNDSSHSDSSRSSTGGSIAISDLIGAVEHSLVHSTQTLSLTNATHTASNSNAPVEASTVIAVPITLPTTTESTTTTTPATTTGPTTTTVASSGSSSAPLNSDDYIITPKPNDDSNINNITILQTINSTQVHAAADDATMIDRIQHQHITLFSAGAGIFPQLPSIKLRKIDDSTEQNTETGGPTACGHHEDSSIESGDGSAKPKVVVDNSSVEEVVKCALPSTASSITATSSSTSSSTTTEQSEVAKEQLKTKIAEVEAEPVILTQGI